MKKAFVFPGQASQSVGMGKEFYDNFASSRKIFDIFDEALGYSLSDIIFNGPEEKLTSTENAQPAIAAVSLAITEVLKEKTGKDVTYFCDCVAGHSLGEYSALCAAGSLSVEDTARILYVRGKAMKEASSAKEGAMAACIGIPLKDLEDILSDSGGVCDIANDNSEGQIVISGEIFEINRVASILKDIGYRSIVLKVGGAFHSRLMESAEGPVRDALEKIKIKKPSVPVIANVTAKICDDPEEIRSNLVSQICARVRWRETLDRFAQSGISEVTEIGPGKILSGIIKRKEPTFSLKNINSTIELNIF